MTRLIFLKNHFHVSHPHPFLDLLKKYPGVYKYANKGLKYIPKEELFLTRLCYHEPVKDWTARQVLSSIFEKKNPIEEIQIVHSPKDDPVAALAKMNSNETYYRNWYMLSYAGLPFSALCTLLPGPNVFLLYNLFRLYSYKHSTDGIRLLKNAKFIYNKDDLLEAGTFEEISKKYDIE